MKRLRQQREVHARVLNRKTGELAALPGDVFHPAPRGKIPRPCEHGLRMIDRNDRARPARGLEGQISLAAAQVGDIERRQQMTERAGPRGPAATGNELTAVAVCVEVLLAEPEHFLEAGLVGLGALVVGLGPELALRECPDRRVLTLVRPALPAVV